MEQTQTESKQIPCPIKLYKREHPEFYNSLADNFTEFYTSVKWYFFGIPEFQPIHKKKYLAAGPYLLDKASCLEDERSTIQYIFHVLKTCFIPDKNSKKLSELARNMGESDYGSSPLSKETVLTLAKGAGIKSVDSVEYLSLANPELFVKICNSVRGYAKTLDFYPYYPYTADQLKMVQHDSDFPLHVLLKSIMLDNRQAYAEDNEKINSIRYLNRALRHIGGYGALTEQLSSFLSDHVGTISVDDVDTKSKKRARSGGDDTVVDGNHDEPIEMKKIKVHDSLVDLEKDNPNLYQNLADAIDNLHAMIRCYYYSVVFPSDMKEEEMEKHTHGKYLLNQVSQCPGHMGSVSHMIKVLSEKYIHCGTVADKLEQWQLEHQLPLNKRLLNDDEKATLESEKKLPCDSLTKLLLDEPRLYLEVAAGLGENVDAFNQDWYKLTNIHPPVWLKTHPSLCFMEAARLSQGETSTVSYLIKALENRYTLNMERLKNWLDGKLINE